MPTAFRHEACFYDGSEGFLTATLPFVRAGLDADEAVLVVVDGPKIAMLRDVLGDDAASVAFEDMADVGHNPARIIPAWARFVDDATARGRGARGIGEPIGPGRSAAAVREFHLHESLLNNAFADGEPWWLLCPYDTTSLDPAVLDEARRTHPFVDDEASGDHRHLNGIALIAEPLPEPTPSSVTVDLDFDSASLRAVRELVRVEAEDMGLGDRVADVVLAVHEIATNSTLYGGGRGRLRAWRDDTALVLEVRDTGRLTDPLLGRVEPPAHQVGGRGLWLCNQLCDLVQVHSGSAGTVVRVHVALSAPAHVKT